jgi:hypothetical protein
MAMGAEEFFGMRDKKRTISKFEREIIRALAKDREYQYPRRPGSARSRRPNAPKIALELERPLIDIKRVLDPRYQKIWSENIQRHYKTPGYLSFCRAYQKKERDALKRHVKKRLKAFGLSRTEYITPFEESAAIALSTTEEYQLKEGDFGVRKGYGGRPNVYKIARELGRGRTAVTAALRRYDSGEYDPNFSFKKEV